MAHGVRKKPEAASLYYKMMALVFWLDTNEVSVIPLEDIKNSKGKEPSKLAKWGKMWYPVKVIKTSESKSFLDGLEISVDGKIITPERRSLVSTDLIAKKRLEKHKRKINEAAKQNAEFEKNKAILQRKTIFEKDQNLDYSENEDSQQNEDDEVLDCSESDLEINPSSHDEICKTSESYRMSKKQRLAQNVQEEKACSSNNALTALTVDEIEKLKQILKNYDQLKLDLPQHKNVNQNEKFMDNEKEKTAKEVELVENSGVFVNRYKLENLKTIYSKKPKELVRQLMKMILTVEVLCESSPTGKNGWKPIPENVFVAVEAFVNENAPKKKYTLDHTTYRQVLTAMCATLRYYSKNKKENNKMVTMEVQKNDEIDDEKEDMDLDDDMIEIQEKEEKEEENDLIEENNMDMDDKIKTEEKKQEKKLKKLKKNRFSMLLQKSFSGENELEKKVENKVKQKKIKRKFSETKN